MGVGAKPLKFLNLEILGSILILDKLRIHTAGLSKCFPHLLLTFSI